MQSRINELTRRVLLRRNATKPNYPDSQLHTSAVVILGYLDPEDPSSGYNLDMRESAKACHLPCETTS